MNNLADAATRFLPPARQAAQEHARHALDAAAAYDVLGAGTAKEALEIAAAEERRGRKVQATDLALRLIVEQLEAGTRGERTVPLDNLLKVVGTLDPDAARGSGNTVVAVEVVVRNEGLVSGGEGG